jgi:hypothetical protein
MIKKNPYEVSGLRRREIEAVNLLFTQHCVVFGSRLSGTVYRPYLKGSSLALEDGKYVYMHRLIAINK